MTPLTPTPNRTRGRGVRSGCLVMDLMEAIAGGFTFRFSTRTPGHSRSCGKSSR